MAGCKVVAQCACGHEVVHRVNCAFGVNGVNTIAHDGNFFLAERSSQCMQLAIDIAGRNNVEIDQSERTDTGPGESLNRPGPRLNQSRTDAFD